jgi:23S rRNA (guanine2445-N2)-methyltransferase / 23S rRNA (guanine2069-N7)-methyltransferase
LNNALEFFATAPRGVESLLAAELRALGAEVIAETGSGVSFRGSLETGYRACLWSRLASRILLPLARFPAITPEEVYSGAASISWGDHLESDGTLTVDCSLRHSPLTHSHYASLKVKDAVVDQFRDACGVRPSVARERPDLRINLHLERTEGVLSLDLSGESLHRRGYREEGMAAPLKENLAAAILLRCNWPEIAAAGGGLVDPMCGSGTLPIEAALIAADIAPGLTREHFGFFAWLGHDASLWERLLEEARGRREQGLAALPPIAGYDADPRAIRAALANAARAGLAERISFEQQELSELTVPPGQEEVPGLLVVNPPYGERLGEMQELKPLYATLGERLRQHFSGWKAAVFTGNPELGKALAMRSRRIHSLFNGALACQLLHFDIDPQWFYREPVTAVPGELPRWGEGPQMLANRLAKNLKNLGRWARREGIFCYRLYDADLPEYAVAVDVYQDWVHVQEYEAPKTIDPKLAATRLQEAMAVIPVALGVAQERVFLKVRRRQKGSEQYRKLDQLGEFHEVGEGACRFLVNFTDYLDTGLFLDHRLTRAMIGELSEGKRFLNLFAYTGTATVHAAMGGALSTVTVDMSRTYLGWAKKNMALNGFADRRHEFVQADCLEWLATSRRRFGLIFLDPPTFSNSKSVDASFDVQRDHVALLQSTVALLEPEGVLIFSNNNRRFKMDRESLPGLEIEDISRRTIPKDFERSPRIHNCWKIRRL